MAGVSQFGHPVLGGGGADRLPDRFSKSEVVGTHLIPNSDKPEYATGKVRPTIVTAEEPYSCELLVDSTDAIYPQDTPFNFNVDFSAPLLRARTATVQKVILPVPNNVNKLNNTLSVNLRDTNTTDVYFSFTRTLNVAIYDTESLANEITTEILAGMDVIVASTGEPFSGTIVCNFDPIMQVFTCESTSADLTFYFWDTCTFITRGRYLAGFDGGPASDALNVANYYQKHRASRAGMVFTRFVTVHSNKLTENAYQRSKTSDPLQGKDIIAVVDVTGLYGEGNYDVTVPFSGAYKVMQTPEAPKITLLNSAQKTPQFLDFFCKDEYGFSLDEAMENTVTPSYAVKSSDPPLTKTASNKLGISLWLEVTF